MKKLKHRQVLETEKTDLNETIAKNGIKRSEKKALSTGIFKIRKR